ncbi:MAG TPA: hypothetical protein VFA57_15985 [Pseudolabrys sp.]|nr:hypothetical protein [Pseudolabrys sp.]
MLRRTKGRQQVQRLKKLLSALTLAGFGIVSMLGSVNSEIRLPWIAQKTVTDCGRAVLAALAARDGRDVDLIYRRIPDPSDRRRGYSIAEMQEDAEHLGVKLLLAAPELLKGDCGKREIISAYYKQLSEVVDDGHPVVIPVVSGPSIGHYVILVSTTSAGFRVHDPASRGLRTVTTADLEEKMCRFGFVALIVD